MPILWKGINWSLRNGGIGGPGFAGWSASNVILNPDGTVTLKLTNPTGTQPIGCEMIGEKSLGYGTYALTVEGRMDNLNKNVVLGGLFPYYGGSPYIEFDTGEVSAWDGTTRRVSHTTYKTLQERLTNDIVVDSGTSHKFVFKWEPGKVTYDTYKADGSILLHTEHPTDKVPGAEKPMINLWAFANGTATADDKNCPGATFILKDFSFVPLGSPVPTPTPTPTPVPTPTPEPATITSILTAIKTEINGTNSDAVKVVNVKKLL